MSFALIITTRYETKNWSSVANFYFGHHLTFCLTCVMNKSSEEENGSANFRVGENSPEFFFFVGLSYPCHDQLEAKKHLRFLIAAVPWNLRTELLQESIQNLSRCMYVCLYVRAFVSRLAVQK